MCRDKSLEKTPMLGKFDSSRRGWHQRMRCVDNITYSGGTNLSKLPEMVKDREPWSAAVPELPTVRHDLWLNGNKKTIIIVVSSLHHSLNFGKAVVKKFVRTQDWSVWYCTCFKEESASLKFSRVMFFFKIILRSIDFFYLNLHMWVGKQYI